MKLHDSKSLYLAAGAHLRAMVTNLLRPAIGLAILAAAPAAAQEVTPEHAAIVKRIMEGVTYKTAIGALQADHERWVQEVIKITEIPAPPFKEQVRAAAFRDMLNAHGLIDVEIDAEGNAMGLRKGTGGGGLVVVSAHLDTVFPEGTDVKVKRDGSRLLAPGVGDDSAGLATLLSFVRAMDAAGIKTKSDILFVGDVGEEGPILPRAPHRGPERAAPLPVDLRRLERRVGARRVAERHEGAADAQRPKRAVPRRSAVAVDGSVETAARYTGLNYEGEAPAHGRRG